MNKICLSFVLMLFSVCAFSSNQYYEDELSAMASELKAMTIKAESKTTNFNKSETLHQLFDLSKRLHRLEEEAMSTGIAIAESGDEYPQDLEFAQNISKSIDLSADLLGAYLRTGNEKFLILSKKQSEFSRYIMSRK